MNKIIVGIVAGCSTKYKKPLLKKQDGMTFLSQIMEKFNPNSRFCLQCSGCHGGR